MNTMISGASGALTVFFIYYFMNLGEKNRFSLVMVCNGNLAGLVAITGLIIINYKLGLVTM